MKLHFGTPTTVESIADALPLYSTNEFESATRSTVPMLSLLMHAPDIFSEIVRRLDFPGDYELFLEYTVRPPKGRGKASHTDVMLKSATRALGIEGKWTEPMYPTVVKWLKAGKDQANRLSVLEGWLSLLHRQTQKTLRAADFHSTIYQMLHRAASVATADVPTLAYFLFEPSPDDRAAKPDDIFDKLADLWQRLGVPTTYSFNVVEIQAKPLEAYEPLRRLPKGQEVTAEAICVALQDSRALFDFGSYRVRQVS
jgi:hypothetical protein